MRDGVAAIDGKKNHAQRERLVVSWAKIKRQYDGNQESDFLRPVGSELWCSWAHQAAVCATRLHKRSSSRVLSQSWPSAAIILDPGVSHHLMRYETHFRHEIDATIDRIERSQQERKGQPPAPRV